MGLLKPIKAFTDFLRENQKEGMTVAEIGVYDGSTTSDYIDIIKNNKGHLYVVDWFNGNVDTGGTHGYNPNNHDSVIDLFKNNIVVSRQMNQISTKTQLKNEPETQAPPKIVPDGDKILSGEVNYII